MSDDRFFEGNELPLEAGAAVPRSGTGPEEASPEQEARYAEVVEAILARTPEHMPEPTLHRVTRVMELLGDPQRAFPMIHLTGTNGKTSTTRMVERLLREMGLRTGRFTSPHLHDMRERISLDGEPIGIERFIATYDDVLPFIEMVDAESMADEDPQRRVRMTYFEVVVCLAYAAFADAPVDVAVVEVGLGGVWDATSVADGVVAVVTPISIDHTRLLGSTVEEIATEKAGIVKGGSIAVVSVQEPEAMSVLVDRADAVGADLRAEGVSFGVLSREVAVGGQLVSVRGLAGDYTDLFLPVFGPYQAHNAAAAIAAVEAFVGGGEQPLSDEVVRAGLAGVTSPGRLEIVRRSPTVVVDAAQPRRGRRAGPGRGGVVHLHPPRGAAVRPGGQGRRADGPGAGAGPRPRRGLPHHLAEGDPPGPPRRARRGVLRRGPRDGRRRPPRGPGRRRRPRGRGGPRGSGARDRLGDHRRRGARPPRRHHHLTGRAFLPHRTRVPDAFPHGGGPHTCG